MTARHTDPMASIGALLAAAVVAVFGDFTFAQTALGEQRCLSDEGPTCLTALQTLQAGDRSDVARLSVGELVARCDELRRNLACLLGHTRRCVPQADRKEQHARIILEARKYIGAVCEADESVKAHWKDNKCYRQASLQRCDREFQELMNHKVPSNPPTDEQCRTFGQYQSCVHRTMASCGGSNDGDDDDDDALVALYLLDYGSRLAWMCPAAGGPGEGGARRHQANVIHSADPAGGGGPPAGGPPALGPAEGTGAGIGGFQQGGGGGGGKAAFSGSSTCVKLIQNDMRRCYNRYQRQESELKKQQSQRNKSTTAVASDAQQVDPKPKVCCAFGAYTHCLQTAVQTRCSQDREALVDTIISQTSKLIGGHCDDYYYGSPKCSSAAPSRRRVLPAAVFGLAAVTLAVVSRLLLLS